MSTRPAFSPRATLTVASGGISDGPGTLVAIRDHINLTARNPLSGENDDRLGPRFPDMSSVYDPQVRSLIAEAAAEAKVPYREGVYAWFMGPSYETPAEVEMARRLGADLVGMSFAWESPERSVPRCTCRNYWLPRQQAAARTFR